MLKKSIKSLALIGMMGSGKSSVGRLLAKEIKFDFFDSDIEIESASNLDIREIFEKYGEDYFRKAEFSIISRIISIKRNKVLSVGGGAFARKETINILKKNCYVIYLKASIMTLTSRLKNNLTARPLLNKKNLNKKLYELMKKRSIFYEDADLILDVDKLHLNEIVKKIKMSVDGKLND